jgi:hypothetical protein
LELDPDHVISRGQVTLLEKQRLIDDCLENSYEISLGCCQFGNCLVILLSHTDYYFSVYCGIFSLEIVAYSLLFQNPMVLSHAPFNFMLLIVDPHICLYGSVPPCCLKMKFHNSVFTIFKFYLHIFFFFTDI